MDFFESQHNARRNTLRLVVLFILAILALVLVTNFLVMAIFGFTSNSAAMSTGQMPGYDWRTFLIVGAVVTGVILLGSLYKISALSGGGATVAEMMNGRLLIQGSEDLNERRVLNVVEEMAIASGTPVPPVYLMEEAGINAFAAGYAPGDAVIGVTRGAIDTLSREQLQGVIAHEFSHILNGDMRINIRLIGVLHGILILGIIGYHLLRGGTYSRRSRNGGGAVALGLGLVVIGAVGTFFGNLIKAAVSRQRESLADASAVQFTRNPEGLAGALMKIATHDQRSYLNDPSSKEISHALFEEPAASSLRGLYATHPPIEERIKAILPNWDGDYSLAERGQSQRAEATEAVPEPPTPEERRQRLTEILAGGAGILLGSQAISRTGTLGDEDIAFATELRDAIDERLLAAAHDPSAARALIYRLILSEAGEQRDRELEFVREKGDRGVAAELDRLLVDDLEIDPALRLVLVDMALPSLRQLSTPQYRLFRDNFAALVALDQQLSLSEWSLQKIVFDHLDRVFDLAADSKMGRRELKAERDSVAMLLSMVAHCSPHQGMRAGEVFEKGAALLDLDLQLLARDRISLQAMNAALDTLRELKPLQKPQLLKACAACITADQEVTVVEAETFRAIAALLDCPMPPLRV